MKVSVIIDDVEYQVDEGKNLLETVLSLGLDLPYFCWHPALHSVGACRQCTILKFKDAQDAKGRLVVACMEPVVSGIRIAINAPEARVFRASVIESLMLNHPHDCPVCDEGGECHLQDMTVMTGHNYRRSTFAKRTFNNQDLGPFVNHEMNRCVECYRCVRFYKDYAGGKDLDVFASRDHVYFGRAEEGTLENEFSGNLIEVCPTGVFTDKTLKKQFTRKWDLSSAPSICQGCSLGCNISVSERYGEVRRVLNRYNGKVNGYFICDRGRFGYEYINSDRRVSSLILNNRILGRVEKTFLSDVDGLEGIKSLLSENKKVIGIGSPKASLESNYVLRDLVGAGNFYGGVSRKEARLVRLVFDILKKGKGTNPSLKEVEGYDTVLVLGEDVSNTAPMLALSLRQAARNKGLELAKVQSIPIWNDAAVRLASQEAKGPFYLASVSASRLDDIAFQFYRASPDDIARLGYAIAHQLNPQSPVVELDANTQALAQAIAADLLRAQKPLIVSGTSLYSEAIVQSANEITCALAGFDREVGAVYVVPDPNSIGLQCLAEQDMQDAFLAVEQGGVDAVIVMENDLYQRFPPTQIDSLFKKCNHSIVLSSLENESTAQATYVLPAATFAEADGTVINNEGRAQRFYASYQVKTAVRSSWMWLNTFRGKSDKCLDEVIDEMIAAFPILSRTRYAAPSAAFRKGTQKIPREPHRYSGRTSVDAGKQVSEPQAPKDLNSPLSFTMEGYGGQAPSAIIPFVWSPGWNSVQAINKFQAEIGGSLREGDPGIRIFSAQEAVKDEKTEEGEGQRGFPLPLAFVPQDHQWLVVPLYHIFGSEELTAKGPAIRARVPEPYAAINLDDAARLGLSDGNWVAVEGLDKVKFLVNIRLSIPLGVIGLPCGLEETKGLDFPFYTTFRKIDND